MHPAPSFATSNFHFPYFHLFPSNGCWRENGLAYISKPDVCSCCVNPMPPNSSWTIWKSAGGQMVKSEIPPSPSCHKSCLAAQNKLLLETSLLALYPLPFITSKELQKAGKKNLTTPTLVTPGPSPPTTLAKVHSSL